MRFLKLLSGKKTYAIGLTMIVLGILQGDNQMILEALGFIFIRHGIASNVISTK